MTAPEFRLLDPAEMPIIVPLLMELDPDIPEATLRSRLPEMLERGYECIGLFIEGELAGICGFWILTKYYVGRHLEPDNVFIRPAFRGGGIGRQLDLVLQNLARERGCRALELNCYTHNDAGKQFWEAIGYDRLGIHYRKRLE
jgi:GNAT superfamily N-acetyltransferase